MALAFERGQGSRPAIVVQGFINTDFQAHPMVIRLRDHGIHAVHAKLGVVTGLGLPLLLEEEAAAVEERLIHESDLYGETEMIGYSWGGHYATLMGIRHPERVSRVTTVASPPREAPIKSINLLGRPGSSVGKILSSDLHHFADELRDAELEVPELHIHGSRDLVVNHGRYCESRTAGHAEIRGGHMRSLYSAEVADVIVKTPIPRRSVIYKRTA